jgi:hypothetical protein
VNEGDLHVAFKGVEAIQRNSPILSLHLKADFSQQLARILAYHLGELIATANPGLLRRQLEAGTHQL